MRAALAPGLGSILLINPNTSTRTTAMMVEIAQAAAGAAGAVRGATASVGVPMIVNEEELAASAPEVLRIARQEGPGISGIIVSAFGDPGLDLIRNELTAPAVGLCEASMREASIGARRFGVATVTPGLAGAIGRKAAGLGLGALYAGIRLTEGDPRELAADPVRLEEALAGAVEACIRLDGAEAVIIGGGPLGQAASALGPRFRVPIIAPIAAATACLLRELAIFAA
jgi:allantoin racemase